MDRLFQTAGYCMLAWLIALALLIAFRILQGEISLAGILATKDGNQVDPERVQSLLVSLFVLGAFIAQAFTSGRHDSLPEIPQSLLILLTGSNGIYLSGKLVRLQRSTPQGSSRRPRASQRRGETSRTASPAAKRRGRS